MDDFDIVVIGASAGGLSALESILMNINRYIKVPIVIVQHLSANSGDSLVTLLKKYSVIELSEPIDKEFIMDNHVYLAPADYHVMIEKDRSISLSLDPKVNYCRPAIDVLFETAAEVYYEKTLGILLTGANCDGTNGFKVIKKFKGTTIAQNPEEAQIATMPESAINAGYVDFVLNLKEISIMLNRVLKEI
ncbi:MAG: chemotaxis protein CheB [Spirochaetaceae bacterium]